MSVCLSGFNTQGARSPGSADYLCRQEHCLMDETKGRWRGVGERGVVEQTCVRLRT